MTEKELKKMNRYQLLELLIFQTQRADKLQEKLDTVQEQLSERNIEVSSLGSIAEASLQLSGIFRDAQEAADMYIAAAKKRAEEIEEEAYKKAAEILAQAKTQKNRIEGE